MVVTPAQIARHFQSADMNQDNRDYLKELARFVCGTRLEDLSDSLVERARWVVADSLAVTAAGMQAPEMKALAQAHFEQAMRGNAWVVGTGQRIAPLDAALLNGTAGTWLELDEGCIRASGHPGIQVVPAALAYAQEHASSGAELLLAVVLGYELCGRVGAAARLFPCVHPHGTWGVIGAAVAAGRLAGLDQERMRALINIAATMGMATSYRVLHDGATVRNVFAGHSGYMGQMALRLVQSGFTGETDALKSIYGAVLSPSLDLDTLLAGLGHDWLFAEGYYSLYPPGRPLQSAIDALAAPTAKPPDARVDPASIERIEIKAYRKTAVLGNSSVTNTFGAKFSVPFAVASILQHGRAGLECFEQAAVDNPAVAALAARVVLAEDAAYTVAYPGRQLCDLTIVLKDGARLDGHSALMKGEPGNPYQPHELMQKFLELGAPVWGETGARDLLRHCMQLERVADLRAAAAQFAA